MKSLSLGMFSSLYFTSLRPNFLFSTTVLASPIFVLTHIAFISLVCSAASLPTPPFQLRFSFSSILPYSPLAAWVGEPRIHVVQGKRWETWVLSPLAKTTSPAFALCLSTHRYVPQILHTFSQNISLNHSFFPFHFLSSQPLTKSNTFLLNLKWKATEIFSAVRFTEGNKASPINKYFLLLWNIKLI